MNETFDKLKLRAVREADVSHIDFDNLSHTDIQILGDAAVEKKLVELVVQECAKAIINDVRLDDVRSAANGCVVTIKKHFGRPFGKKRGEGIHHQHINSKRLQPVNFFIGSS